MLNIPTVLYASDNADYQNSGDGKLTHCFHLYLLTLTCNWKACTDCERRKRGVAASSRGGEKTSAAWKKGAAASRPNGLSLLYLQHTVQGSCWPGGFWLCGSCATQAPSMINKTADPPQMPISL